MILGTSWITGMDGAGLCTITICHPVGSVAEVHLPDGDRDE